MLTISEVGYMLEKFFIMCLLAIVYLPVDNNSEVQYDLTKAFNTVIDGVTCNYLSDTFFITKTGLIHEGSNVSF